MALRIAEDMRRIVAIVGDLSQNADVDIATAKAVGLILDGRGGSRKNMNKRRKESEEIERLKDDLKKIANESMLPDGDVVSMPIVTWATEWVERLGGKEDSDG